MDNKKLVPQIRFKGFHDEWKEKKAEYIFITINDKNHIELPVLSATQEYGMVERCDSNYNISYNRNNLITYKKVSKGQFVIHLRSFQGGFAHSNIMGITSPAYTIIDFKIKNNHNDKFWKYILSSEKFIKKLELVTYGIRDGRSINFNDFCILKFKFPVINEQKKISKLFENIDTLISKKQIKLEKVKALKQTLLKKMFPSENSDVPEIRFKGFTEKWEKKKLMEISVYITSNYSISSALQYGKYSIYDANKLIGYINRYLCDKDYICIIKDGSGVGRTMYMKAYSNFIGTMGGIVPNTNINPYFLYCIMNNINLQQYVKGFTIPHIYFSDYSKHIVFISTTIEQEKIGNYFYKLDNLINLYEKEIEKLQKLKKAFFGKMFV